MPTPPMTTNKEANTDEATDDLAVDLEDRPLRPVDAESLHAIPSGAKVVVDQQVTLRVLLASLLAVTAIWAIGAYDKTQSFFVAGVAVVYGALLLPSPNGTSVAIQFLQMFKRNDQHKP